MTGIVIRPQVVKQCAIVVSGALGASGLRLPLTVCEIRLSGGLCNRCR